jgi:hypothetical protein
MRLRLIHPVAILVAMLAMAVGIAFGSGRLEAANLDEACGGPGKITCNSALWCQTGGGQCKAEDAAGTCDKAPAFCMRVSRPVCGCNGKTYANDCERQKAKVQLDHAGPCPKEPGEGKPKATTKSKAPAKNPAKTPAKPKSPAATPPGASRS